MKLQAKAFALFSTAVLGGMIFVPTAMNVTTQAYADTAITAQATTDLSQLGNGTYEIGFSNYKTGTTTSSSMDRSLKQPAKVVIMGDRATVTIDVTSELTMNMMTQYSIGPDANHQYQATKNGMSWVVTVPKSILGSKLATSMGIDTHTEKFGVMHNTADMVLNANAVTKTSSNVLPNGTYTLPYKMINFKSPEKESGAKGYFKQLTVNISGENTTVSLQSQDSKTDSMTAIIENFKIDVPNDGDINQLMTDSTISATESSEKTSEGVSNWSRSIATERLFSPLTVGMTYSVDANFGGKPFQRTSNERALVNIDLSQFTPALSELVTTTPEEPAQPEPTPTPEQPADKPSTSTDTNPGATVASEIRELSVLRGDANEESIAGGYFIKTAKTEQLADGSYYVYVTSKTPMMMGKQPIDMPKATLMETKQVGTDYESTYRLHVSAAELNNPILTQIHVQFTSPITYNETYDIRLVLGKVLSSASTETGDKSTPTEGPTGTTLSTGNGAVISSLVSHATPAVATRTANLRSATVATAAVIAAAPKATTTTATDAKQADQKPAKTAKAEAKTAKSATDKKADNKQPAKKTDNGTKTVLAVAGTALVAALGYAGTMFGLKKFKG